MHLTYLGLAKTQFLQHLNSISPNRFTTLGEQRAAVGVDAGEVLQTDGHLAYADAKVFYQGVPLGSKEVDYGFLIDIAKLRTRSSSRIRAARGGAC